MDLTAVELAPVEAICDQLRSEIEALSDAQASEFYYALDQWAATVEDGREALGLLNQRYELCRIECGAPAPWILAVYDTQRETLVIGELLPEREAVDCPEHARRCALALGEPVNRLDCY